jgi:anti-sigma factor RsiW
VTSTTDTAGHPDVAEISDLAEGILPPSRTAEVRRHLDECELCADVYASLEEIRGLLGTLPGPPRMPDDVAGRIDAALAAEALLTSRAPESADGPALVGAPRSPDEGNGGDSYGDGGTHVSRETSVPADRPVGRAHSSTTGPGRKGRKRAGRRRIAVLGAVFTAAALGIGSVLVSSLGDGNPSDSTARGQQTTLADTFAEGKLKKQVADLLAENQSAESGSRTPHTFGMESDRGGNSPKILQQPTVPHCVREGIGRNDEALATEDGIYKGTQSLLVVLPDSSDATRVIAYIVDRTCADHPSSDATANVLLQHSYARSDH